MLTILRLLQFSNTLLPKERTLLGMKMLSRLAQPLKASWSIPLMELVMFTSFKLVHPSKMLLAMLSILVVKEKLRSDVQFLKATHPIAFTLLGISISSSEEQSWKQE